MTMHLFGITWRITSYAWLLLLVPCIVYIIFFRYWNTQKVLHALAGTRASVLLKHTSRVRRLIKLILLLIGLIFLGISLLQPHWDKDTETVQQYGRDVCIVLDISRSMLAQDVVPNRLEVAKLVIKKLVAELSCERVGLVLFAGNAFVQCPLTEDYGAFNVFLDHVDVETIASGSTSLEAAFDQVINMYERIPARKHKLVALVTDGEDFSDMTSSMQDRIHDAGLTIFAIGVGTENGAPIPLYDEHGTPIGHQKDAQGNVVISCHNAALLQDLVQKTGGEYIGVVHDQVSVKSIINRIMHIEKEFLESSKTWMELKPQYPYFVALSFICFLIEWLL